MNNIVSIPLLINDSQELSPDEQSKSPKPGERLAPKPLKWATNGHIYWGGPDDAAEIEPGMYTCGINDTIGAFIAKMIVQTDDLIELPGSVSTEVINEIRTFWKLKDRFTTYGYLHKRGILLYGPPGSGKTCTLQQMVRILIEEYHGIALFIDNPHVASAALQLIRKIEPDRPIIVIMEDIDGLIRNNGVSQYLALLDGEAQVDNVVFVATTNFIEELEDRIKARPSRFDLRVYVGMPNDEARRAYLKHKIIEQAGETIEAEELEKWVAATEGMAIAHLRELIAGVRCLGKPFEQVIDQLRAMQEKPQQHDGPAQLFGFSKD